MDKIRLIIRTGLVILLCGLGLMLYRLPPSMVDTTQPEALSPQLVSGPVTPETVGRVLATVYDPEIRLNIVDLGLVRSAEVGKDGKVTVTLILTSSFCPYADYLVSLVETRVKLMDRVEEIDVRIDDTVPWGPDMMSGETLKKFMEGKR